MPSLVCSRCGKALEGAAADSVCSACQTAAPPATIETPAAAVGPTVTIVYPQTDTPTGPTFRAEAAPFPQLSGYEILGELGRGGMGVVYRARQTSLDRLVAIKALRPDAAVNPTQFTRFEQEARNTARLRHPNIVTAFDFLNHDGSWFLVMELLLGEDLNQYVERVGAFDEATTWAVVRQVASGLAYAAQLGMVHRDIKPANLFLGQTEVAGPHVKITDFGLALLAPEIVGERNLTNPGAILGTPAFMAPEQFSASHVDWRADLYALGASAVFMLTGKQPYGGLSLWDIMKSKMADGMPTPTHVSAPTRHLLERMLAPNPQQRFASYQELLDAIDKAFLPSPPGRGGEGASLTHARKTILPRWLLIALLLLAGGLTIGAVATWRMVSRDHATPAMSPGKTVALFNGKNLAGWFLDHGNWQPTTDEEGGTVLAGTGLIRRPIPKMPDYRLLMGVDLKNAAAVEIHFGADAAGRRYVFRITPQEAVLGEQQGEQGELRPLASKRMPRDGAGLATAYREVKIDRAAGAWHAFYHGQWIGSAPAHDGELPEFRLRCDGGPAFFETIELVELLPAQ